MADETVLILLRFLEEGADKLDETAAKLDALGAEAKVAGDEANSGFSTMSSASRDAEEEIGSDAEKIEGHGSRIGGVFEKLAGATQNLPLVGGFFEGMSKHMEDAESKGHGFLGMLQNIGEMATVGTAAGLVVVGGEALHLAMDYQTATSQLAAATDVSTKAATAVGKAFLTTAGQTTMSAQTMMAAYAPVAEQLATVEGHALGAAQALQVMTSATDLAEGSGTNLASATSALAGVMQAYSDGASQAAAVSNVLFEASEKTGVSINSLASMTQRMHSQLGALTPSLGDVGGLLVDLAAHGETGRQALSAVQTAMSTMLSKGTTLQVDINAQNEAFDELSPKLQLLAKAYQDGSITQKQFTAAGQALGGGQDLLLKAFESAQTKVNSAQAAVQAMGITVMNASGHFVGMGSVITQLDKELAGHTQQEQLADLQTVFGTSANRKLLDVVLAGPSAYDAYTAAVTRANSAHTAAEKATDNLHGQIEKVVSGLEDEGVKLGQFLIPILEKFISLVIQATSWLLQHRTVLEAVAIVFGTILVTAIGAYIVSMAAAAVATVAATWPVLAIIAALTALGVGVFLLVKHWREVWADIKQIADDAWHFLDGVWHKIEATVAEVWGWIGDFLHSKIGQIVLFIVNPIAGLVNILFQHWSTIKRDALDVWNDLLAFFRAVPGDIIGFFESLPQDFLSLGEKIVRFFLQGFANLGKDLLGILEKIPVVGGLFKTGAHVAGAVGHFLAHPFGLAEGGIVNRPEMVMVGEHGPEVVLPMNDINRSMQLLQQAGMLSAIASATTTAGAVPAAIPVGRTSRLAAGAGAPAGRAQFDLLMERLLDMYAVLEIQQRQGQELVAQERATTNAVGAAASKIAGGIVNEIDRTNADLAQLVSRRVR